MTDISSKNLKPPLNLFKLIHFIKNLDCERLGEVFINRQAIRFNYSNHIWVFINKEKNALVNVLFDNAAFVTISSEFSDGFRLETSFPLGYTIDHSQLYSQTVRESISAAYDYHMQQIQRLELQHGTLSTIPTISGLIENSRKVDKFYWLKIRNIFPFILLPKLLLAILWAVLAIFFLIELSTLQALLLMCLIGVPAFTSIGILNRSYKNRAVDARKKKDYADAETQMV